ncbi:MAG: cadmium-translocating P-type ATPase [Ruminococcaceae bacterium]|nr:cadmium-translocating P-type ATPase [Oscillospiraceae bacterium]
MKKKHKIIIARILISFLLTAAALLLPIKDSYIALLAVLSIPYFVIGYDVLWSALRNIFHGQIFDENFLMAIATVGAFAIGEYYEAVGVMIFYQTGELFQSLAVGKSRRSIAELMDIRPDSATVLRDGGEITLSPEEVSVGEVILVRPGERIPLDGEIIEGATSLDLSALTGESLPADKGVGEAVVSGSVNLSGLIKIRVNTTFGDSTVSRILDLVENSATKKSKAENFITRFARYYTPCVVFGAMALALIPPLLFGAEWIEWIERALIFLMVSCPCALVISVPLSFFGGIGGASRMGVLIKGANYLEMLSKIDTVVFDKTGTLTRGSFEVVDIHSERVSKEELLEIAAYAESFSNHPIARSIVRAYPHEIKKERIGKISEYAGMGLCATVDGKEIYVGNRSLMNSIGLDISLGESHGGTVHIGTSGEYLGHIEISDSIKPSSKRAIKELREGGIEKTVMLTGDSRRVAERIGNELNIDDIYPELLPEDKVTIVEKLIANGNKVAFVGDGINDAPVLARADVGISMGGVGSDAAIEASDIVLMDDDPSKISRAIKLSKKTMRIVRQNIIFALGVKGIILILGALGYANMWVAVFGDVGVAVIAIFNAMRSLKSN